MGTWIKPRHGRVYRVFAPPFRWFLRKRYGFSYSTYTLKGGPYLILSNHQTKHDQFLISILFDDMPYFVCRDDILKSGLVGRLVSYLCAPIPKSKVAKDIKTIRICRQIIHEGGNVAIFPEGNLTFDGKLGGIDISTAKLVKLLNVPVVFVNIKGGYGTLPRWHNKGRRGYFTAQVVNILQCEQYAHNSPEQLLQTIVDNLSVDELASGETYENARGAEYLEHLLYVCPHCGFAEFVSHKNQVRCTKCNSAWTYERDLTFTPKAPFANTAEWQTYQREYLRNKERTDNDNPIFRDKLKWLKMQNKNTKQTILHDGMCELYYDKMVLYDKHERLCIPFEQVTGFALLGKNKMEFCFDGRDYYLCPNKRVNAVKYMHFYARCKEILTDQSDESLGF